MLFNRTVSEQILDIVELMYSSCGSYKYAHLSLGQQSPEVGFISVMLTL